LPVLFCPPSDFPRMNRGPLPSRVFPGALFFGPEAPLPPVVSSTERLFPSEKIEITSLPALGLPCPEPVFHHGFSLFLILAQLTTQLIFFRKAETEFFRSHTAGIFFFTRGPPFGAGAPWGLYNFFQRRFPERSPATIFFFFSGNSTEFLAFRLSRPTFCRRCPYCWLQRLLIFPFLAISRFWP